MPNRSEYLAYVLEQLAGVEGLSARPMFGGHGLYRSGVIFGIVFRDTLYFKVSDASRPDYESRGMARFRPFPDRPLSSTGYYEVPAEVLEDGEECVAWARKAAEGRQAPARPAARKPAAARSAARRSRRPRRRENPRPK